MLKAGGRVWITGLLCIIGGVLAASSLILSKRPDAKKALDKIAPFQGIIGVALLGWGLWDLYYFLIGDGALIGKFIRAFGDKVPGKFKIWTYTFYYIGILEVLLGFLLGYGLIASKVGGKNPEMAAKGEAMQKKLAGIATPLGIIAVLTGLLWIFVAI